jgi:zinc finger protein
MVNPADNDALEAQFESQFQKPGDLVERDDDDTGLMQVESLCMSECFLYPIQEQFTN